MTDWSRVGRSSRRKGHSFERMIAKVLNQKLGSNYSRTPCSGGHDIVGDLYEPPEKRTMWSNLIVYCRTGWRWAWEDVLEGNMAAEGPLKWALETGLNTFWVFRSRPGSFYVCFPRVRMKAEPHKGFIYTREFAVASLDAFAQAKQKGCLNLEKML